MKTLLGILDKLNVLWLLLVLWLFHDIGGK